VIFAAPAMTLPPIRLPLAQRKIWAARNTRHAGIEFFGHVYSVYCRLPLFM